VQEQILRVENELKLITEKKLKMLALLRGRYLRYEMKSKEVRVTCVVGVWCVCSVADVSIVHRHFRSCWAVRPAMRSWMWISPRRATQRRYHDDRFNPNALHGLASSNVSS
jgi:hypothetical protein